MKFKAKPVTIDAIRFVNNWDEVYDFTGGRFTYSYNVWTSGSYSPDIRAVIREGSEWLPVHDGDYIIRDHGHFKTLSGEEFEKTYEPVRD